MVGVVFGLVLALSFFCPSCAITNEALQAWQRLYDSTNGLHWQRCNDSRSDPCSSTCVVCSDDEIVRVLLDNNNVSGTLPSLNGFSSLAILKVGNNSKLEGTIPELGTLNNLTHIYLNNNHLSGSIPGSLAELTNLLIIRLDNNQLTGSFPYLPNSHSLLRVLIRNNRLSGALPSLDGMTNLNTLFLENNQLTGTIPSLENMLSLLYIDFSSNQLTGTIPSLAQLPQLEWFGVFSNALTGTIPDLSANSQLSYLNLADNHLTGTIPELASATSLFGLALFDNYLTGTLPPLPRSLFDRSASNKFGKQKFMMVHNNFLSCALPADTVPPMLTNLSTFDNSTFVLAAIGNQFPLRDGTAPRWLSDVEICASLLFVTDPPLWQRLLFCTFLGIVICLFCLIIWAITKRVSLFSLVNCMFGLRPSECPDDPAVQLIVLCLRFTLTLVVLTSFVLLPVYSFSANLYKCGEELSRLSLAYTHDSPKLERVISAMTCVFTLLSSLGVALLYGRARVEYVIGGVSLARPPGRHWSIHSRSYSLTEPIIQATETETSTSAPPVSTPHSHWKMQSVLPKVLHALQSMARICIALGGWISMLLVMSIPTIFYEALNSLPRNNTLGVDANFITVVRVSAVPLLVVFNNWLVPVLSNRVVEVSFPDMSTTNKQKLFVRLVLVTRLFLLVVVPVAVVVVMDNGCFQMWKLLWEPCRDNNHLVVREPYEASDLDRSFLITAFSTDTLCQPKYQAEKALCSRRVVEIVSSLMLLKMMFQALASPLFLLVWHGWVRLRLQSTVRIRHHLWDRVVSPPNMDNFALMIVTWVELAIVYGCMSPLVLLAVVFALITHLGTYRLFFLRSEGEFVQCSAIVTASTVCPPLSYLVLSVLVYGSLITWFFESTRPEGWEVVVVVVPAISLGLLVHLSTRLGGRWIASILYVRESHKTVSATILGRLSQSLSFDKKVVGVAEPVLSCK